MLGVAAAGWWYSYVGTPQHSLARLADAVRAKDYESARYFVDDERIADTTSKTVIDAAVAHMSKEMKANDNPFSGLGVAAVDMMAPRIRESAKDNIKEAIKQALSGNESLTEKSGASQWGASRLSTLRIGDCVVSGNTAEVLVRGVPQPNPAQITEIHLRMARILNSRELANRRNTGTRPCVRETFGCGEAIGKVH